MKDQFQKLLTDNTIPTLIADDDHNNDNKDDPIIGLEDQALDLGTHGDYNIVHDTDWTPNNPNEQSILQTCQPIPC